MRRDRLAMRLLKTALLFGVLGLTVEGLFELKRLLLPFTAPPSVPGQSKIIEHFMVQHVAFPVIALALVFAPLRLQKLFASRFAGALLGGLAVLVTVPELLVSRADLFRPYPFDLHSGLLRTLQIVEFADMRINLLQAQHLMFAHFAVMGAVAMVALGGTRALRRFAGPRTGEASIAPAVR